VENLWAWRRYSALLRSDAAGWGRRCAFLALASPEIRPHRYRCRGEQGLDQRRETLDPEQSLTEALTGGSGDTVTVGGQSRHVIGYMKD
jgi:hypothetical protein